MKKGTTLVLGSIFLTTFLMVSFQNCAQRPLSESKNLHSENLSSLSAKDSAALIAAEQSLRKANLNVYDFIEILSQMEKMTVFKDFSSKVYLMENATPEQNLTRIQVVSGALSSFFGFLNSIPTLTGPERASLSNALDQLRVMSKPRPDDMVLKALVLLVEIKTRLVEEMDYLQASASGNQQTRDYHINAFLDILSGLSTEMVDALAIARPSKIKDLEDFRQGLLFMSKTIVDMQKDDFQLPPEAVPAEAQLQSILNSINAAAIAAPK